MIHSITFAFSIALAVVLAVLLVQTDMPALFVFISIVFALWGLIVRRPEPKLRYQRIKTPSSFVSRGPPSH